MPFEGSIQQFIILLILKHESYELSIVDNMHITGVETAEKHTSRIKGRRRPIIKPVID